MNQTSEKALKTALKLESDGAKYYRMAAKDCPEEAVKQVFLMLAREEDFHYDTILKCYDGVMKDGKWAADITDLLSAHSSDELKNVFTPDFFTGLKGKTSDLSAFSVGVLLEEQSIDFYSERAEKETDPVAKKFYQILVGVEQEHHDLLVRAEKELMEESWQANRFAPF